MAHAHDHGRPESRRALGVALGLTAAYTAVEVVGGLLTGSLALLADAVHMLSDNVALVLALVAVWLASRPTTPERTYGYKRAEVLAALANGVLLVALAIWIFVEAAMRLRDPGDVLGGWMLVIAVPRHRGERRRRVSPSSVRAATASTSRLRSGTWSRDLLGSIGVAVAAIVIVITGWTQADALVSILIGVLVLASAWGIVRDSTSILLEAAPEGHRLRSCSAGGWRELPGVVEIHDLHVWTITSGFPALVGARARPSGRRLPRPPARARTRAARRVRDRAHDAPGRPRGRRRPGRDGPLLG